MTDEDVCQVCKQTFGNHQGKHHPFTPPGARVDVSQFARKRPNVIAEGNDTTRRVPGSYAYTQAPFDPVLRQALIDKGILSPEDLEAARKKVEMITGQITRGGSDA